MEGTAETQRLIDDAVMSHRTATARLESARAHLHGDVAGIIVCTEYLRAAFLHGAQAQRKTSAARARVEPEQPED